MSDIFTMKTVPLTSELGIALKKFRIEQPNKVTASSMVSHFKKASSFFSKLENGDIKKIESDFLIEICNFISGTENGLSDFITGLSSSYTSFSDETKLIIMNIDDLIISRIIPANMIREINEYMNLHNITIPQLTEKINLNEDIIKYEYFEKMKTNIWESPSNNIDSAAIKLYVPQVYIEDLLLTDKIHMIHRVIAEAILYSLFRLGNESNPSALAHNKLRQYQMTGNRIIKITADKMNTILDEIGLEPDTAKALKSVTSNLKFITTMTKEYGSKKIKQIANNMDTDISFYFAYMAQDVQQLSSKDKEKKTEFLRELKSLIDKYSQEDTNIDMYE